MTKKLKVIKAWALLDAEDNYAYIPHDKIFIIRKHKPNTFISALRYVRVEIRPVTTKKRG